MKRLKILILVFIIISCSKEELEVNIDKNLQVYHNNNEYYDDNILKFRIQIAPLGLDYIDNFDNYFKYIEAGQIKKGKLTLDYNIIDEKYCNKIIDEFHLPKYHEIKIDNNEAKIKIIKPYDIFVFNNENKDIGFLRYEDYNCKIRKFGVYHSGPCSTIYFIYATDDTKITGKDDFDIYDLNLKKGWNKVYYYEKGIKFKLLNTTNNKKFSNKIIWEIIMIG